MKKIFTKKIMLAVLLMMNVGLLSAQQLLTDNFNYSGALTANGWAAHSGTGASAVSTTTGLTYTGLSTSGIGNAALIGSVGGGEDVNRTFTAQTTDGQNIYFSAMVNITEAASAKTGDYIIHLGPSPIGSTFISRVFVRVVADAVNFGISNNGTANWGTTSFAKNTTYLLVVKYTISTTANDPLSMWVIPAGVPASEAAAGTPEVTTTSANGNNSIGSIALRQGSTSQPQTVVDGLLVGLTWADVTPTVATGPTLGTTGNATNLSTVQGTASASGSFNVTGTDLTGFPGTILATASSTDFQVSNDNASWGPTTTIPYTSATLAATPVYVRLSATAPLGTATGTVSLAGGGATTINANVGGNVLVAEPTVQASNIVISAVNDNGFTIDWTNGNGAARIIAVRQTTAAAIAPADGSVYTTTLGGGNTIWYNNTGNATTVVTGLVSGTSYTVHAYEYNGSTAGTTNYLTTSAANNPVTVSTTGISPNIQQGFFTSVSTPLYGARSAIRIPTVAVGTISGLAPNTTYRYYSTGASSADFGTSNSAGTLVLNDYTVTTPSFYTASTGSLTTAGSYGKFTSDANGKFTGTFGYFASTNNRFDSGANVFVTVTIGEDVTPFSVKYRFALDQSIKMLDWGTAPAEGSFIKGASLASANNVVALWNSIDGNIVAARPLAMTLVEDNATTTAPVAPYDETAGSWNTVIPNDNPEGVRLIQQFTPTGVVVGCNSDADGTWPSGVSTSDPVNGSVTANALQITVGDAPLNAGSCFGILPVSLVNFTATKVNRTVTLKWTTAQELNSRNFVIERSTDNRTWTSIATVAAAGFSNVVKNYAYVDNTPAKGINYYRLKQVDVDYRSVTSAVRPVLFSEQYAITVAPNPATDFINVYIAKNDQKTTQVIVADINGKVIEKRNTADQLLQISTSRFAKGVYFVKVLTDEQTTTQKVIVQ
ncbi:T9SS type A sorting domain-containing protein [Ferruginibacter sp. HRS2-29]|uniref:T9SS type A sorting domain-containing protein n=1 Tax=Ferruginibacter sp. HRS2-29 TaxID=2487334 RepID=UPI0020CFA1A1|nr:T9SS type A sorting domain-containing protein [Ferruginibacter sp. HRS2-29]MCP9750866.1 T9SS C-terminal target domain-containing protein [Ferruginibacter sp. HRS2-29]